MLLAVLADLHANMHAADAVLREVRALRPDGCVLLGDVVGYNASPRECIAFAREHCQWVVMGNHDHDAVAEPTTLGTGSAARQVQQWTRRVISSEDATYLELLPRIESIEGQCLAVHGCFLNDTHYTGYVTSTMLEANLQAIARRWELRVGFCGHTHVPMVGWLDGESCVETSPSGQVQWPARARSILINPGSVGQPRDHDWRAAFALVDTERRTVEVKRVPYDLGGARRAITEAGLPEVFGERLEAGR